MKFSRITSRVITTICRRFYARKIHFLYKSLTETNTNKFKPSSLFLVYGLRIADKLIEKYWFTASKGSKSLFQARCLTTIGVSRNYDDQPSITIRSFPDQQQKSIIFPVDQYDQFCHNIAMYINSESTGLSLDDMLNISKSLATASKLSKPHKDFVRFWFSPARHNKQFTSYYDSIFRPMVHSLYKLDVKLLSVVPHTHIGMPNGNAALFINSTSSAVGQTISDQKQFETIAFKITQVLLNLSQAGVLFPHSEHTSAKAPKRWYLERNMLNKVTKSILHYLDTNGLVYLLYAVSELNLKPQDIFCKHWTRRFEDMYFHPNIANRCSNEHLSLVLLAVVNLRIKPSERLYSEMIANISRALVNVDLDAQVGEADENLEEPVQRQTSALDPLQCFFAVAHIKLQKCPDPILKRLLMLIMQDMTRYDASQLCLFLVSIARLCSRTTNFDRKLSNGKIQSANYKDLLSKVLNLWKIQFFRTREAFSIQELDKVAWSISAVDRYFRENLKADTSHIISDEFFHIWTRTFLNDDTLKVLHISGGPKKLVSTRADQRSRVYANWITSRKFYDWRFEDFFLKENLGRVASDNDHEKTAVLLAKFLLHSDLEKQKAVRIRIWAMIKELMGNLGDKSPLGVFCTLYIYTRGSTEADPEELKRVYEANVNVIKDALWNSTSEDMTWLIRAYSELKIKTQVQVAADIESVWMNRLNKMKNQISVSQITDLLGYSFLFKEEHRCKLVLMTASKLKGGEEYVSPYQSSRILEAMARERNSKIPGSESSCVIRKVAEELKKRMIADMGGYDRKEAIRSLYGLYKIGNEDLCDREVCTVWCNHVANLLSEFSTKDLYLTGYVLGKLMRSDKNCRKEWRPSVEFQDAFYNRVVSVGPLMTDQEYLYMLCIISHYKEVRLSKCTMELTEHLLSRLSSLNTDQLLLCHDYFWIFNKSSQRESVIRQWEYHVGKQVDGMSVLQLVALLRILSDNCVDEGSPLLSQVSQTVMGRLSEFKPSLLSYFLLKLCERHGKHVDVVFIQRVFEKLENELMSLNFLDMHTTICSAGVAQWSHYDRIPGMSDFCSEWYRVMTIQSHLKRWNLYRLVNGFYHASTLTHGVDSPPVEFLREYEFCLLEYVDEMKVAYILKVLSGYLQIKAMPGVELSEKLRGRLRLLQESGEFTKNSIKSLWYLNRRLQYLKNRTSSAPNKITDDNSDEYRQDPE